ncbi:hypothetical protein E8E13_005858 [Curvularia kusanoi]|uniref:F-box domain-containing protein n=1 Tax=Curvularia kusanoi TaxID=90978 RepID=A0A9P4T8A2_CURKU|nr:hypothetical protein E8E13_005858 [Curvularia kusanoi]
METVLRSKPGLALSTTEEQPKKTLSLLDLPGEIRNPIYNFVIGNDTVTFVQKTCLSHANQHASQLGHIPLASTCRQLYHELRALVRLSTTINVEHFSLNRYLQTFHPLGTSSALSAKLRILLPKDSKRPTEDVPFVDITHLLGLMIENPKFTCSIGQTTDNSSTALTEAASLETVLCNLASSAQHNLTDIFSIRLVLRRSGPTIWYVFKQHTKLPGEWPWYGAHDLEGESWRLWVGWLKERKLLEMDGWHISMTVHASVSDIPPLIWLPREGGEYAVMPEEQQLASQWTNTPWTWVSAFRR